MQEEPVVAAARTQWATDPRNTVAGWSFSEEELTAALRGTVLLNPSIDLTNACNLNCPYCFIEEKNSTRKARRPDELTVPEILAVLSDLAESGARTVNIVGAGEPTVDPFFAEIVAEIASLGITPVVFTNGIRIAQEPHTVDTLWDVGATVVLKYNSMNGPVQDLVAGRDGYASVRDEALARLLQRGFSTPTPTRLALDTIAFQGNYAELPAIHRFCRSHNIHPLIADYIPTGRTEGGAFFGHQAAQHLPVAARSSVSSMLQPLDCGQRHTLFTELAEIDRREFGIERPPHCAYYSGGVCSQSLGIYVDIQGNIWPCVARSRVVGGERLSGLLGNVRHGDKPSVIWRSHPYFRSLRDNYTGACPYKPALKTQPGDSQRFAANRV